MKKILIVEDDTQLYGAIEEKLQKEGFEVLGAKNGEEGLAKCLEEKPDLTLLDILMPRLDGFDMLEQLRKDEWGKNAKVIILTNLSGNDTVAKAIDLEAYETLIKSDWTMEGLVAKIKEKVG